MVGRKSVLPPSVITEAILLYKNKVVITKDGEKSIVDFKGGDRKGLRVSLGHYSAITYRSNGSWEHYDDMRDKMLLVNNNKDTNS